MNVRWLFFLAGAAACASSETVSPPQDTSTQVPDASVDDAPANDAAPPDDATASCDDCEWFPAQCSADVLCKNDLFAENGGSNVGFDPRTPILAIRGRAQNDVWLSGSLGALAHFDGTSWRRSDPGSGETMLGLWLNDSTEIAIGSSDTSFRFEQYVYTRGETTVDGGPPPSPGGWTRAAAPLINPYRWYVDVASVWGATGATWSWLAMMPRTGVATTSSGLLRLRASTPGTFELALGPSSDCRPGCDQMRGVHGSSANDVWAVGSAGTTIRITDADGDTPTTTLYDSQTWNALNGVWAPSASEAWSVGGGGTIRHFTGDILWEAVADVPTDVALNAIWGSSSSDVWAVGDQGVVLHFDGQTWSRQKIAGLGARRPDLMSVWTGAPGHVWIGGKGVVLSLGGKP